MVKKVEEKIEEDVKEKEVDEVKDKEIEKKKEEIDEEKKIEKEIETPTPELETTIEETKLENDPWSEENWKSTFPELFEKEISEKAEEMTKEDVVRICREQIKEWLKGTSEGKYPLPKNMARGEEKTLNKIEDVEGLNEQLEKSITLYKSYEEKFNDIAKTFEELKKEVQIIKDQPAEIFEKSLKDNKDIEYKSPFLEKDDGSIAITK